MKKEKLQNVLVIVGIFAIAIAFWTFLIWAAFIADYGNNEQSVAEPKEEVVLAIEVLEAKQEILVNDEEVILIGPAKYKIVRAAYKDLCWYNHINSYIYGSGEDIVTVNTASEDTYKIYCEPLIGRGDIVVKTMRVIVMKAAVMEENSY